MANNQVAVTVYDMPAKVKEILIMLYGSCLGGGGGLKVVAVFVWSAGYDLVLFTEGRGSVSFWLTRFYCS